MTHTVESIKNLLATNDKAIGRALIVLRERQTDDEQRSETTKYHNGRGFRPCHARMGTSMANFFQARGFLTPKQVNYWRTPMRCGNTRIEIYAKQLLEQANLNAAAKAPVKGDVGNYEEARMIAAEMAATKYAGIDPDELAMMRMEAEGDREQTMRDELNKFHARQAMERM